MEIRSSVQRLKTTFGVLPADIAQSQTGMRGRARLNVHIVDGNTVSSALVERSQTGSVNTARAEKVAAVKAALVAGTYSVPATAVACRLVNAMLTGNESSRK